MLTDATTINPAALGKSEQSKVDQAASNIAENFDDFIKILTVQLQNQDPSDPLDANQFTEQIVAMTEVEQSINTNRNLESMLTLMRGSQLNNVVSYIGKFVEAAGDKVVLENGVAEAVYELDGSPKNTTVSIQDELGRVIFSEAVDARAGRNSFTWDGVHPLTGVQYPSGAYKMVVTSKDFNGQDLIADTFTIGKVTAVDIQNEQPTLSLGGIEVPIENVRLVREAPSAG